MDRCKVPNGMVDMGVVADTADATDEAATAAAVWAAFNATDGGNMGLHGECELTDAVDDVSGTPDVEYKS